VSLRRSTEEGVDTRGRGGGDTRGRGGVDTRGRGERLLKHYLGLVKVTWLLEGMAGQPGRGWGGVGEGGGGDHPPRGVERHPGGEGGEEEGGLKNSLWLNRVIWPLKPNGK
jgi:hypothetical protein